MWAAAAAAAAVLVGTAGTEARWTDQAAIPGGTVRSATVTAPTVTCSTGQVSWAPVPAATGYEVYVGSTRVGTPSASPVLLTGLAGLTGSITVRAEFGPWVSGPSTQTCSLL